MWRWLVPYGLTAIPVTTLVVIEQLWVQRSDLLDGADHYHMGAVTVAWLGLMIMASPTILYYRLLIFAGERAVPRRPLTAVATLILLCGLVPPLVQNWWASRSSLDRDFTGPAPGRADTIVIADRDGPRDRSHCAQTCARLLFGGGARRVLLTEPETGGVAPAVHLEQRPTCPPVSPQFASEPESPATPTVSLEFPQRETGGRVLAQIASGRCLVATSGRVDEAGLRLGRGGLLRPGREPVPDGFALIEGDYSFVERRENGQWVRLSQRMGQSVVFRWLYPFAFLPNRQSWVAGLARYTYVTDAFPSNPQPWRWAGVTLPDVPDLGWQRIREMLRAAVTLPRGAPRDARHQLARQYLAALQTRPPDEIDRALLRSLPADRRFTDYDPGELERALAYVRDGPAPPRPAAADGARPAGEDLGYLGTRQYAAFAFDVAMLLALNLIVLGIALRATRRRARKDLPAAEVPVQAPS